MPETRTLRAYVELVGKEQFEKELKSIQSTGEVAGKKVVDAFDESSNALGRWGAKLGRVGSELTQYVTVPLAALSAGTLKFTTDVLRSNEAIATLSVEGRANARALLAEWDQLKGGLTDVRNELVEGMLPVYRDLVTFANDELVPVLKEIVHQFSEQSTAAKEAEIKVGMFLAVLGPGIKVVSDFAIAIGAIKYAFGGMGTAALIVIPILGTIAQLMLLINNPKDWRNWFPQFSFAGAGAGGLKEAGEQLRALREGWRYTEGPEEEAGAAGSRASRLGFRGGPMNIGGYQEPWQEGVTSNQIAEAQRRWGPITPTGGGGGGRGGAAITPELSPAEREALWWAKTIAAFDEYMAKVRAEFGALSAAQRVAGIVYGAGWRPPRDEQYTEAQEGVNMWFRPMGVPWTPGAPTGAAGKGGLGNWYTMHGGTMTGSGGGPAWQRNDFLWQTAFAAAGPLMQGGGVQDALGAVLPGIGYAVGGPVGGGIGMILAGLLGKKQRGESPQNPVYVKDINTGNLLTEMLNATKSNLARAGAGVIDTMFRDLRMQGITRGLA